MPFRVLRLEDACLKCIEENVESYTVIPTWVPEDLVMFIFRYLMRRNKLNGGTISLFLKTSLRRFDFSGSNLIGTSHCCLTPKEYRKFWKTFSKFSNFVFDKECTVIGADFKQNDFLEQLYIQNPPNLSELNLQFCRKLTHCFIVSSELSSLSFQSNDNLQVFPSIFSLTAQELLLDCPKVVSFQGLSSAYKLTSFTIKSDVLESLDLTNKSNLKSLTVESKSIKKIIDFQNCTELTSINLETKEEETSVKYQRPLLEYLRIANEKLETLELKGCLQLLHVELECPK